MNKFPIDNRKQLEHFLQDIRGNDCILQDVIGDNPKRAILREARNHAGYYACEYCEGKACTFISKSAPDKQQLEDAHLAEVASLEEQIEIFSAREDPDIDHIDILKRILREIKKTYKEEKNKKRSSHLVWPSSTYNSALRTEEGIRRITDEIQDRDGIQTFSTDELKGFVGRSLLLDLPDFDFILSVPT